MSLQPNLATSIEPARMQDPSKVVSITHTDINTSCMNEASQNASDHHGDRARCSFDVGVTYRDSYRKTKALETLDMAIWWFQEALEQTLDTHPHRASRLQELGAAYFNKFRDQGALADLEIAIKRSQDALDLTPRNDRNRTCRLQQLGIVYENRFRMTGALADLEAAIVWDEEALRTSLINDIHRAGRLQQLGIVYNQKYKRTKALTDLEMAVQRFSEAVDTTPNDHPFRASRLHQLGVIYKIKFRRTGALIHLEEAIKRFSEAAEASSYNDPDHAIRLRDLGSGLFDRFQRSGALEDLETAIRYIQEALKATSDSHLDRASLIQDLGTGYLNRARRTGAREDLETAIQRFQEALDVTPVEDLARADRLQSLASGYDDRLRRTGAIADLEKVIQYLQEAFEATPYDHPGRGSRLFNLGIGYQDRYRRTGALEDLDIAIQRFEEALQFTPDIHIDRAKRLQGLAAGYSDRYRRTRALADLNTAVKRFEDALEATPEDHPDLAMRLQNVGASYSDRFRRIGATVDIDKAIQRLQEASEATPDGHPDRARRWHDLGGGYHDKYRKTKVLDDLNASIEWVQVALQATPDLNPDRARRLHDLGIGYRYKYQQSGASEDLEVALQRFSEALEITPYNHPDLACRLQSLGAGYSDRYRRTKAATDLEMTILRLQEAAEHVQSRPIDRLKSAILSTRLLAIEEKWSLAYSVASTGLSLIPLITPRFLENADKQYLLADIVGFASDGAAIALSAGKTAYDAIRFLELGRGIILGSLSELRTDVPDLQYHHPQLAERFAQLKEQLDSSGVSAYRPQKADILTSSDTLTSSDILTSSDLRSKQRYDAAGQFEGLLKDIRKLPGFDTVLYGPTEDEIKSSAAQGPVVMINVTDYRCDALIVDKEIQVLRLPLLHASDIQKYGETLGSKKMEISLLEWLWKTIGQPVLNELGISKPPQDIWPRLWWIPVGALAKFPLHAAGYHLQSTESVLDRVVSSYSSSFGSLSRSRRRNSARSTDLGKPESIVLVGMPELSYTSQEIQDLKTLCNSMNIQVNEPQPLREDIITALSDCDIFHFAGHGYADPLDPSKSALILSDGELTVSTLFETNLHKRQPFLAYLSACGTGRVKGDTMVDESLHLIAASQLAGFQHVIGTLWEVDDRMCVDVAKATYKSMQKNDISDQSVREGLHHACRDLRNRWVQENALRALTKRTLAAQVEQDLRKQLHSSSSRSEETRDVVTCDDVPLYWVPYVHFGT